MDRVRIEVLGPIRVLSADGGDLTPDGALQRRLLALLVLRRDRGVTADTAIEVLWPGRAPRDPVAALQNQVSRLRRRLPAEAVESTGNGYTLTSARIGLDVDDLAGMLHAGALDAAAGAAVEALLERWHGPAYPELDDVEEGRIEATRLDDLRVRALEARAERKLSSGDHTGAIAELAALTGAEPLREHPRALLMAALARAGRHVEALRVYDEFRRLLGDELGIEPSPALTAQHADLLTGSGFAGWTGATRLPVPGPALLGRDELVAAVVAALETDRVVTLVGPGGVGKTRTAVEIGHRLQDDRPDRAVVLAELAPSDERSAVDAVAAALGIDPRPGVDLVDRVAGALDDAALVLIVDNCEHVLDPVAGLVERLVARCPHVTVLATSRERLRVPGEVVRAVAPLHWDGREAPAVELFVQRARAVAPDFAPGADEEAAITEIVQRLDGLPLAIELAAARLHTLEVAEVAAGLDQRFTLLSSGYRPSTRHGSLSAVVTWSFDLLDEPLRRTFADLSVFAGTFTAEDAAAVTGTDPMAATDALSQLTERSLVLRAPGRRYVLLETLRAFGTEQLAAAGRAEPVGDRHARHQVEWIEHVARHRMMATGPGAIAEIDAAIPELRAALGWLLDHGRIEPAGRLVVALLDYGFLRQRPDVLAWAERVIAADPGATGLLAAQVWAAGADASWLSGDLVETGVRAGRALEVAERAGGAVPAKVATVCGSLALFEGRLDDAVRWYGRAADATADDPGQWVIEVGAEVLARAYGGDPAAFTVAADLLAEVDGAVTPYAAYAWYCAGEADLATDVERARERYTRAIDLAEATNASFVAGVAGASRASIDARFGDPEFAAGEFRRLIGHWRRAGVWSTQWTMLRSIAVLLERLGRPRDAAVLEGAVRSTAEGHRIFGADEAALAELSARLRDQLGDDDYESARQDGARLDGDAAVEHALRSL